MSKRKQRTQVGPLAAQAQPPTGDAGDTLTAALADIIRFMQRREAAHVHQVQHTDAAPGGNQP